MNEKGEGTPVVVLISGSVNAGKTTVAQALLRILPRTAHIEVDALRAFVECMTLQEAIPLSLTNAVAVTRNCLVANMNVVVTYPLRSEDFAFLTQSLDDVDIVAFTLAPRIEVAMNNRGTRVLTEWERERVEVHYATGIASPKFGHVIDNSDIAPEGVADIIMRVIKNCDGDLTSC